jgi:hypothetical protein
MQNARELEGLDPENSDPENPQMGLVSRTWTTRRALKYIKLSICVVITLVVLAIARWYTF